MGGSRMTTLALRILGLLGLAMLAACTQNAGTRQTDRQAPVMESMIDPATGQPVIPGPVLQGTAPRTPGKSTSASTIGVPVSHSAAALNTTTATERAQAAAPATPGRLLGTTIASLGDPSQPGFWIKTPLVRAESDGRIVNPANGKSAKVRLIPLGGPASGGSQVSLPALQLLGISLTDLPSLEVYQG